MSRDLAARREMAQRGIRGLPAFIIGDEVVVGLDTQRIEALLDYTVLDCPACSKRLRLPKGEGHVLVTCPHCFHQFGYQS